MKIRSSPVRQSLLSALCVATTVYHGAVIAADSVPPASVHQDTLTEARAAVKAERWPEAIKLLEQAIDRSPKDADAFNLLAYSQRKSGQIEKALKNYKIALKIDPDHLGAHEYIGEAYVLLGNAKEAQVHLKHLERLCPKGCEERDDLQRAISEAKKKR